MRRSTLRTPLLRTPLLRTRSMALAICSVLMVQLGLISRVGNLAGPQQAANQPSSPAEAPPPPPQAPRPSSPFLTRPT